MNYKLFLLIFLSCTSIVVNAQVEVNLGITIITEREVAVDLDVPWEILYGQDDFIWATERKGRVLHINPITGNTLVILDIQDIVNAEDETGMLGMAFHPDFPQVPKLYLAHSMDDGNDQYSLNLVTYDWNGVQLENRNLLLKIPFAYPISEIVHHGSRIVISNDQKIFITVGDGFDTDGSQDLNKLSGKILRLNLNGTVPEDNPIDGSFIYSFGHRNPQGLAIGLDGKLFSTEHGSAFADELNLILPARNYGWPEVEGNCNESDELIFCQDNDVVEPVKEFTENGACIAISDLVFYNHEAIPEWQGKLLLTAMGGFDGNSPRISIREVSPDGSSSIEQSQLFTDYGRIRDVCVNPINGAIYFATNGENYPGEGPNRIIEYRNLEYQGTSINKIEEEKQFIKIHPNIISPNTPLNFKVSTSFIGSPLSIYSYSGKTIQVTTISSEESTLNNLKLPSGKYFISATNENGTISKSFIIR